jgi:hypothetical protein
LITYTFKLDDDEETNHHFQYCGSHIGHLDGAYAVPFKYERFEQQGIPLDFETGGKPQTDGRNHGERRLPRELPQSEIKEPDSGYVVCKIGAGA